MQGPNPSGSVEGPRALTPPHRVFIRMWGVAALAHLAANGLYGDVLRPSTLVGFALAAVGLLGTAAVVAPRRRVMLALCTAMPVSAVLEAPFLGNHWLLAGLVSLGYLATGGNWERFRNTARAVTLVFYAFAAFAKLNEGFFDPATSCAVFYADQAAQALGIGSLGAASLAATPTMWLGAAIELSVVPLVLLAKTRKAGVVLAVTFHSALTLDLAQHFYDFTSVLLALFVLFLDGSFAEKFEQRPSWLSPKAVRIGLQLTAFLGVMTTMSNVTPRVVWSDWFLSHVTWWWWFPYMVYVVITVFGSKADQSSWRVTGLGWALVIVAVANGVTPYLEIKTAFSWNMYSNLQVVNGDSNHLLIRNGVPLRAAHQGMVEVVSADGEELKPYIGSGYLIPWPSFREYAREHSQRSGDISQGWAPRGRPADRRRPHPVLTLAVVVALVPHPFRACGRRPKLPDGISPRFMTSLGEVAAHTLAAHPR